MARAGVTGHLGLGSNLGDRRAHLQAAVDALLSRGVEAVASSSVYETAPVGEVVDQPDFLNACLRIDTALGPEELLDAAKAVEAELGRAAGGPRHGPRPIDVDVLRLGDLEHASPRLRLPHPETASRRFVLVPLYELDPDLPGVGDALTALPPDEQPVRRHGPPLAVASPLMRAFRAGYLASNEAFNRHDFETAFAGMPDDVEWRTVEDIPGVDVARGRRAVVEGFRALLEVWPDWRVHVERFEEPAPGVILVAFEGRATGRVGGVPISMRVVQAWDFRAQPLRITEYRDRAGAVAALGLD